MEIMGEKQKHFVMLTFSQLWDLLEIS